MNKQAFTLSPGLWNDTTLSVAAIKHSHQKQLKGERGPILPCALRDGQEVKAETRK